MGTLITLITRISTDFLEHRLEKSLKSLKFSFLNFAENFVCFALKKSAHLWLSCSAKLLEGWHDVALSFLGTQIIEIL